MLLPLVLSLIAPTAASPILSPPKTVDAKPPDDSTSTRTVYSIVWSCLTTVFACTWIAIHPNIPSPTDSQKRKILRRVGIMLVAIMAPEYVAVWALRQWLSAREITKRMRAMSDGPPNWTITHSFFLVMGGFMLVDESGVLKGTLTHQWMEELKEKNLIAFPSIAEKEIQDKSKGDALSKVILLLQISWFLLQVVARAIRNLPITELELVTVAFASLNLFAYSFWWKKPLNVDCPVEVRLNLPSAPAEVPDTSSHPEVESAQPNESSPLTMDITSIPLSAGPDSPTESDLTPLPGVPSISARENVSSMPFAIVEKPLWNDSFPPPCYDGTSTESEFKLIFELDWLRAVTEPNTTNSWTDNFFPHTVNFTPYWLPPASELATNPSDLTGHPSLPLVSPHVNTTRVIHADKEGPSDSFPLSSEFNARRNSVEITSHFSAESTMTAFSSDSQPIKRSGRRWFRHSWCHHLFSRVTRFLHVLLVTFLDFSWRTVALQIMLPGRQQDEFRVSDIFASSSVRPRPLQSSDIPSRKLRVNTFSGTSQLSTPVPGIVQLLMSLYLGAIHCVAWNFPYPSVGMRWLWRVSALLLTCVPGYFLIVVLNLWGMGSAWVRRITNPLVWLLKRPLKFSLIYLYFAARSILIVLPFILLDNLPPKILLEVKWTTFIPHI